MLENIQVAVKNCFNIKPSENVLIVTEKEKLPIAEGFAEAIKKGGAEVDTYLLNEALRPISEPTKGFRGLIENMDLVVYILRSVAQEKTFRTFMIEQGQKFGRVCGMPGINEDIIERLFNIDYDEIKALSERVKTYIQNKEIRVKNDKGTDLKFTLTEKREIVVSDGRVEKKGVFRNLPAGEIYTCPVEESFEGVLVFDVVDEYMGPGTIIFEKGRVIKIEGENISPIIEIVQKNESARIVGEFGIGTNPKAKVCTILLEAEKALGTVHFAIGDSYGIGKNKSRFHFDAIVSSPDVTANGKYLLRACKYIFE